MKFRSVDGKLVARGRGASVYQTLIGQPEGAFAWGTTRTRGGKEYDALLCLPPYDDPMIHILPVVRANPPEYDEEGRNIAPPPEAPETDRPFWTWDGNREKPTLTPSIGASAPPPYKWHGFLKAGRWEACE